MEERKQNCGKREQYDDGSLNQCREPEGQILIEDAPSETLVLIRISRDAEIDLGRSRKLTGLLEKSLSSVNFGRSIYQQVDQRGVETTASCKHLFGTNEFDFSRRDVVR